jgi:hypothetical protein
MRIRICSAPNEMRATLIKEYLEKAGISTSIAPGNNNYSLTLQTPLGPLYVHDIFVEPNKVDEAKRLLKEEFNN